MLMSCLYSKNQFGIWHLTVLKVFYQSVSMESFPLTQRKESKPVDEPWITMLVSRITKNKLEAKRVKNPDPQNI